MTLLLDSSVLFQIEKGNSQLLERLEACGKQHPGRPCISFITLVEYLVGYENMSMEKKVRAQEFLWQFSVLHTTNATAWLLSSLKYKYAKKGKQKSITDLFIASQALEHSMLLITLDKDFSDIDEIKKVVL
jgi:predicted nucleic acid-binding protein